MMERFNKTLLQQLALFTITRHDDWFEHIVDGLQNFAAVLVDGLQNFPA